MSRPISVLVVDDENFILDCLSIYFEDEGFTVHTATNAESALLVMASLRPQVCITDMGLKGMNGEEFIPRAHVLSPLTRFLIHTGKDFTLTNELRAIGMSEDDIFIKPVCDCTEISDRIRAHAPGGDHGHED